MSNELILSDIRFKAYLEDSDMFYEMKDQQLPFAPTSFKNDSAMIRVLERAKFTFNVFSEDKNECIENYKSLERLLQKIKPSYSRIYDQYVPADSNITGYFIVSFAGIPRGTINLHLTSFIYNINKDLGYLEIDNSKIYPGEQNGKKLIPISYKISIEGKVLLDFTSTTNSANIGFRPAPATVTQQTASPAAPTVPQASEGAPSANATPAPVRIAQPLPQPPNQKAQPSQPQPSQPQPLTAGEDAVVKKLSALQQQMVLENFIYETDETGSGRWRLPTINESGQQQRAIELFQDYIDTLEQYDTIQEKYYNAPE